MRTAYKYRLTYIPSSLDIFRKRSVFIHTTRFDVVAIVSKFFVAAAMEIIGATFRTDFHATTRVVRIDRLGNKFT